MPGHDAEHTGRANFAGPTSAPAAPAWTFSTASHIVGDVVTSVEGTLYFASDQLYALKPDGTAFAPSVSLGIPATGPIVDDGSGLIYIAVSAADGGFDLLSLTKQLQGATVILHVPRPANGAIISPLVLGRGGLVFFVAGRFPGVLYAAGPVQWSNPACPAEAGPNTPFGAAANSPAVSPDGSTLFVMCGGGTGGQGGLLRVQAGTGVMSNPTPTNRNSTEPALDSLQHIRSGWQAFGGAFFCGDYLAWDFSLTLLTTPAVGCDSSRFTTSRAAITPDGQSTVRVGFAFPPNNQLDAEGINNWIISTDGSTVLNFTSLPSVDAAGNVFIGNTQGIEALSPIDGHVLWSFTTGDSITTQPVIANGGALYVGSSSGKVYAFNTAPARQSGIVYVSGSGAGFATVNLLSASVAATNNTFTDGGVIAVSPDGTRSYVSAIFGLAVVDNTTNQVITTISVGSRPEWVALSPDGGRVYVSQPNIGSAPGVLQGVYVIDTATNGIIASIPIPGPQRLAVAPDNSRVYVGSGGRGIAVIDPATNTVVRSIDILGAQTTGIAFTPDGAHAYVGEFNAPSVYLIDARADALLQTIPLNGSLGGGVSGVIASPDGSKVYVGNVRNGPFVTAPRDVLIISTATNTVTGHIPVSFPSPQFAISSDGANLLLGDSDIGNLIVASIASNSVVESIRVNDPCCPNITGTSAGPPAPGRSTLNAPQALDFGNAILGKSITLPLTITNSGPTSITIGTLSFDGPFSLSPGGTSRIVILPLKSVSILLVFTPVSKGLSVGSLTISSDAINSLLTINLSGNALQPGTLTSDPVILDFGSTIVGTQLSLSTTLRNTGDLPIALNSLAFSDPAFFAAAPFSATTLNPGESALLSIGFRPSKVFPYQGELAFSVDPLSVAGSLQLKGGGALLKQAPYTFFAPCLSTTEVESFGSQASSIVESNPRTGSYTLRVQAAGLVATAIGRTGSGFFFVPEFTGDMAITANVNVLGFDLVTQTDLPLGIVDISASIASIESEAVISVIPPVNTVFAQMFRTASVTPVGGPSFLPFDTLRQTYPEPGTTFTVEHVISVTAGHQVQICAGIQSKAVSTAFPGVFSSSDATYRGSITNIKLTPVPK
jgi:YVTN family beta-propeller protein